MKKPILLLVTLLVWLGCAQAVSGQDKNNQPPTPEQLIQEGEQLVKELRDIPASDLIPGKVIRLEDVIRKSRTSLARFNIAPEEVCLIQRMAYTKEAILYGQEILNGKAVPGATVELFRDAANGSGLPLELYVGSEALLQEKERDAYFAQAQRRYNDWQKLMYDGRNPEDIPNSSLLSSLYKSGRTLEALTKNSKEQGYLKPRYDAYIEEQRLLDEAVSKWRRFEIGADVSFLPGIVEPFIVSSVPYISSNGSFSTVPIPKTSVILEGCKR